MSNLEKQLVEVTGVERADRGDQQYFKELVSVASSLDDELWEKLSVDAQIWANVGAFCVDNEKEIPGFEESAMIEELKEEMEVADAAVANGKAKKKKAKKGVEKEVKVSPKKSATKVAAKAPAKASKKAAAETNGAKRGRKGAFTTDAKVKTVVKECPFREGSLAAKCYKEYKVGRTVEAILDAGVPRSKLFRHMKRGVLSLA